MKITAYKLARPDGWDFWTGKTIQYRAQQYPHIVRVPHPDARRGICSAGVGHASENPNDCFLGASIPCSAYRLQFEPVCGDRQKWGWVEATVLEEITDLDKLLDWNYSEACSPLNPFSLPEQLVGPNEIALVKRWASVRASVGDSVGDSVRASVWASVRDSVRASVWASVRASVGDRVWDSVGDSVAVYIGSLFSKLWEHLPKGYPYQAGVDLWKRGIVPVFYKNEWYLLSGPKAKIVWQGRV